MLNLFYRFSDLILMVTLREKHYHVYLLSALP